MVGSVSADATRAGLLGGLHPTTVALWAGGGLCVALASDEGRLALWLWLILVLLAAADSGVLRPLLRALVVAVLPVLGSLLLVSTLLGWVCGELAWGGDVLGFASLALRRVDGLVLRLTVCVATALLYGLVTHPGRLVCALGEFGAPAWLGHVVVASLLIVPATLEQARVIGEAQRARGLRLGAGGPLARLRATAGLLVPLLLGMLQSTEEQALVLQARGLSRPGPRTSYSALVQHPWEPAARAWSLLFLALLFGWQRGWWGLPWAWLGGLACRSLEACGC